MLLVGVTADFGGQLDVSDKSFEFFLVVEVAFNAAGFVFGDKDVLFTPVEPVVGEVVFFGRKIAG